MDREKSTPEQVLEKYPRLVGHMIAESLGYFTPRAAANALHAYMTNDSFPCEWYTHMTRSFDKDRLLEIGKYVVQKSFQNRTYHTSYMSSYQQARHCIAAELKGKGPQFASWF